MRQMFHIFAKDARRLLPEILLSVATLGAFLWIYPQSLGDVRGLAALYTWLPGTTVGLVCFGWLLLIVRLVHGEVLVGERQFWITRPYRWYWLLASKVLFLAVFLLTPFFVMQLIMLRMMGFHPSIYLGGVLTNVFFMTMILVLPVMAIATMTSNFAKMLLGVLLLILFVGGMAYLDGLLPNSSYADEYGGNFIGFAAMAVLIAVVVLQYAQRRTAVSRMLTVGTAMIIGLLLLFGPENLPMRLTYPALTSTPRVDLDVGFEPNTDNAGDNTIVTPDKSRETAVALSLRLANIQEGTAIYADYGKVTIATKDGDRWTSHWQGLYQKWMPHQEDGSVTLKVNKAFFERVKGKPVTVTLTLAMTALEAGKPIRMTMPQHQAEIQIAGGARCAARDGWRFECLAPLRQPPMMLIGTQLSSSACNANEPGDYGDDYDEGWMGLFDPSVDFGITPVWTVKPSSTRRYSAWICPGARLNMTPYSVVWRGQRTIGSTPIRLQDYISHANTK